MAPAVFTSCNVEIGGLRFHYTDWGGDGPPLVMLHGLSGHARTWDDTAAALSGRYRVLAPDQRGHGDTDWAPEYGFASAVTTSVPEAKIFGSTSCRGGGRWFRCRRPSATARGGPAGARRRSTGRCR